jgi:PAS domain S-box-containing protein
MSDPDYSAFLDALMKSEERYRSIIDSSPIGIYLMRGRVMIYANQSGAESLGYASPEDALGITIEAMVAPAYREKIYERIKIAEQGGANPPIEVELLRADGQKMFVEAASTPIQLSDGAAVLVMSKDVTARKQSEAWMASRQRLHTAAASQPFNVFLQTAIDEIAALMESTIAFFHIVDADQENLTLQVWSSNTHHLCGSDGKSGLHYPVSAAGVWVDAVYQRKPIIHNDYASLLHRKGLPEGHVPVTREMVVPVFRGDQIVALIGVGNKPQNYTHAELELLNSLASLVWDIVQQKQAEALLLAEKSRLDSIFRAVPVGIVIVIDRVIQTCNDEVSIISGYSREELFNEETRIMYDDAAEYDRVGRDLYGGIVRFGLQELETVWKRKDGTLINVLLRATALDGRDPSHGVTIAVLDITARKEAETVIKSSLREKETLLREIHHRVKNNLQIVTSLLALQSSVVHNADAIAAMKASQNRVHTMALIHEKLYQSTDLDHIRVAEYVGELVANLRGAYAQPGCETDFEVRVDDLAFDVNLAVPCGLIITELVTNALKYAFAGREHGTIRVSLTHEGNLVNLLVADNGVGLPEQDDESEAKTLGLELVRMLVHQLKGSMEIDRKDGAAFSISFALK